MFDCQSCGACCCNTARNRAAGTTEYVEVTRDDRLWREDRALLRSLGTRNDDGVFHLRLVGDEQRCVALTGEVGVDVACSIYALRPKGCRVVTAGDDECLRARRHLALPRTPPVA
jgi:Fe-S-cluster containining protein